jgi:hypothetical protein
MRTVRTMTRACAVLALGGASLSCNAILGISDPDDSNGDLDAGDSGGDVLIVDSGRDVSPIDSSHDVGPHPDTSDAGDGVIAESAIDSSSIDTSDTAPPVDTATIDTTTVPDTADAGCGATYRTAVLGDKPIDFWELDETSSTSALDIGSKPNPGSYAGTASDPTFGVAGAVVCSTAVDFHGVGLFDAPGTPPFAAGASFSVELWHRPDVVDGTKRFVIGRATATGGGWYMYSQDSGLVFVLFGSPVVSALGAPISIVGYTHIVATYDFPSGVLNLYENGVLAAGGSGTTTLPSSTADLTAGASAGVALASSSGSYDEIALYDHALDGAQVAAHYAKR